MWYRPNDTSKSRLDRVLVTNDCMMMWPRSTQYTLTRKVSDHCALVVKNRVVD